MADRLYANLGNGQYKKQHYSIYSILKDNDHPYSFWYVVIYDSTLSKAIGTYKNGASIKWEASICDNYAIDIRQLSTYIPKESCSELSFKKYVTSIIRKAVKKGEITIV